MTHHAQRHCCLIHSTLTASLFTKKPTILCYGRLTRLLLSILTLHNRQYCLLGYLDLAELWKGLLALWGRLPHSKLTLRNRRYCLLAYLFLEEIDSYENPLGEGYHTHLPCVPGSTVSRSIYLVLNEIVSLASGMRKTHLSCCVSNRSGVLVRVGVRMDPMCL